MKIYASEYLNGFGNLTAEFRKKIPPERWKHGYGGSLEKRESALQQEPSTEAASLFSIFN